MAGVPFAATPRHQTLRLGRDDHLAILAEEILRNLDGERPDVAITNLTHAVRVAYGESLVPHALGVQLDRIVARGGGFS